MGLLCDCIVCIRCGACSGCCLTECVQTVVGDAGRTKSPLPPNPRDHNLPTVVTGIAFTGQGWPLSTTGTQPPTVTPTPIQDHKANGFDNTCIHALRFQSTQQPVCIHRPLPAINGGNYCDSNIEVSRGGQLTLGMPIICPQYHIHTGCIYI